MIENFRRNCFNIKITNNLLLNDILFIKICLKLALKRWTYVWVKNTVDINIRSQDVLVHVYTKSRWPIYRTQFNNL